MKEFITVSPSAQAKTEYKHTPEDSADLQKISLSSTNDKSPKLLIL